MTEEEREIAIVNFKQGFEAGYVKAKEDFDRPRGAWHIWYACPHCGEMRSKPFDTCAYCGADMWKEGD